MESALSDGDAIGFDAGTEGTGFGGACSDPVGWMSGSRCRCKLLVDYRSSWRIGTGGFAGAGTVMRTRKRTMRMMKRGCSTDCWAVVGGVVG